MTVQQAQAEINKCEQEITRAHSALCSAARTVGSSAKECADGSKTKKTLLPLIISVIGIFFYFGSAWFLGLVMIIAGIDKAYNMNQSVEPLLHLLRMEGSCSAARNVRCDGRVHRLPTFHPIWYPM